MEQEMALSFLRCKKCKALPLCGNECQGANDYWVFIKVIYWSIQLTWLVQRFCKKNNHVLDERSTLLDCGGRGQAESPMFYGLLGTRPWQLHLCGFIFMTPKHLDGGKKDGPIFQMFCLPDSKYQDVFVLDHSNEPETLKAGTKVMG